MAPEWDPAGLFPDDEQARAAAAALAERIESTARERVFTGGPGEVAARLDGIGVLREQVQRLAAYGAIRYAVAVSDLQANDISSDIDVVAAQADDLFAAVIQEWADLDEKDDYLAAPELIAYRDALAAATRYHAGAAEPLVAQALAAREPLADAWASMHDRILNRIEVDVGGKGCSVDQALALTRNADRATRQRAGAALAEAVNSTVDLLAHCYDTVVADRLALDELDGRAGPREPRDLDNQLEPGVVDAALDAVASRWDVAQQWYAAKAAALGDAASVGAPPVPGAVLAFADLAAPLGEPASYTFAQARDTVTAAFAGLDGDVAALVEELFETERIDARPRPGKVGNSLCVPAGGAAAYVLTNFAGDAADVVTLAHEIGHALQFTLSGRTRPGLLNEPTVVAGEVAATFAELLVLDAMLDRATTQASVASRTAVAAMRSDTLVATVFRQTALTRFEQSAYAARASGEVLAPERLGRLWTLSMADLYGPAVSGYQAREHDWALVPHFVRTRFYNYSYVLAALASLALYGLDRPASAQAYRRLLSAGASAPTQDLLRSIGVDVSDAGCWHAGLDQLAALTSLDSRDQRRSSTWSRARAYRSRTPVAGSSS